MNKFVNNVETLKLVQSIEIPNYPFVIISHKFQKLTHNEKKLLSTYYLPALLTAATAIGISAFTRLLLLLKSAQGVDWNFTNIAGLFAIGLFYDIVIATYFMVPMVLHLWWTNEKMYQPKGKWVTIILYLIVISILLFTSLVPADFNKDLKKAVTFYFILRFIIFGILYFGGKNFRVKWRSTVLLIDFFFITYLLLFNAISEWFFWDEFSTRYNFIAVDYLVYTNEVLGNIKESYPITSIIIAVLLIAAGITYLFRNILKHPPQAQPSFAKRTLGALLLLIVPVLGYIFVHSNTRKFSSNEYVNELAGNGLFEFGTAFIHNELDFFKFYKAIPDNEAFAIMRQELQTPNSSYTGNDSFSLERNITYAAPEKKMNVVLISVESLSAGYMKAFGSRDNITPNLDSLIPESIFFTNLYSSGTRTVRGLEALALSIPPTPGQSIVKRPNNEHLFSLGSVFRSKGYEAEYIYGGYGYFDNMNYFFGNNGYKVVDRDALKPSEIHYANIWGVADEDLFTLTLKELDANYNNGKNFFVQVMTVSNHRPYTYPEGRIDIPPSRQVREGAVKYTDYAIGKFLRDSRQKPWFKNTFFLIVADHCAGSAGSAELPVTGYHIPLLIYSPGNITPRKFERLTAQIDIPPTILGLLNFNYTSKFFGFDIFNLPEGKERAFISTYQGLGFLKNNELIIQSPVKNIEQFLYDPATGKQTKTAVSDSLMKPAIAYYQTASWLINHKKYNK
jgi:phosphoglycerol transferase MdoB-like AlkP superfamily enzyme